MTPELQRTLRRLALCVLGASLVAGAPAITAQSPFATAFVASLFTLAGLALFTWGTRP